MGKNENVVRLHNEDIAMLAWLNREAQAVIKNGDKVEPKYKNFEDFYNNNNNAEERGMVEKKEDNYNKLGHDGTGFTLNGERLNYVKKFEYVTDAGDPKGFSTLKLEIYVDDSELYKSEVEYFTDAVLEIAREDNKVEVSILDKQ